MVESKKPVQPYYRSNLTVVHNQLTEEETKAKKKKRKTREPYGKWNMPQEPSGYIKSKKNDCL
jgi:hypothetical protein